MFNPYDHGFMSEWIFPFPLPDRRFSKRDLRELRKGARKDRSRLIALKQGELTPYLGDLQKGAQDAQSAAWEKGVEYVSHLQDQGNAAQALIDSVPPEVFKMPVGPMPSDEGLEYLLFVEALRKAQASDEALRFHAEAVARARLTVIKSAKDLQVVMLLLTQAYDSWTSFAGQLFAGHYDLAFGSKNIPGLIRAEFTPYQPSTPLGIPTLEPQTEAPKQLGSAADQDLPDPNPDQPTTNPDLPNPNQL